MTTQAVKYSLIALPMAAAWLILYLDMIPGLRISRTFIHLVLNYVFPSLFVAQNRNVIRFQMPIYAIVMLAVYAIGSVVWGVLTFNDCPKASDELKKVVNFIFCYTPSYSRYKWANLAKRIKDQLGSFASKIHRCEVAVADVIQT